MSNELSAPRIVCAALLNKDAQIVVGARHFDRIMIDQIHRQAEQSSWKTADQGFIDQHGRYYTREQAWAIAEKNGQIIRDPDWCTGVLHSEHLY